MKKAYLKKLLLPVILIGLFSCSPSVTGSNAGINANSTGSTSSPSVSHGLLFSVSPDDKTNTNIIFGQGLTFSADRSGKADRSFNFNGIDQNIKINVAEMKSISVSLWFKAPYNEKAYPTLFSYGDEIFHAHLFGGTVYGAKTGGLGNYANSQNTERLKTRVSLEEKPNFFDNTWHHLTSVYDRDKNKMQLYIDNTLRSEKVIDKDLVSSNYIEIGYAKGDVAQTWYKGEISDINIYSRGLTAGEVSQLYNEGK